MKKTKKWNKKISKRKKNNLFGVFKKRLIFFIYLICLSCSLFLVFKVYNYFVKTEVFFIKEIKICGKPDFSQEYIEKILSFCKGKSIFKVDLSQIKQFIEEKIKVENIIIEKDFPDRLIVRINQRKAIACYRDVLIDREGTVFKGKNTKVPLIVGCVEKEDLQKLAYFLNILKESDENFYKRIQKVDLTNHKKMKIDCAGWNLYWGGLKDLEEDDIITKLNYLKKALNDISNNSKCEIEYIDLRFFDKKQPSIIVKTI